MNQIKIDQRRIIEYVKEFETYLNTGKFTDGKITFNRTIAPLPNSERAKIYFTDMAWTKMQILIGCFDKEVAWHGVVSRGGDESKYEYCITDILVYPQEVTGATVDMDVGKYDEWIRDNADDERFYHIGMQGHSHVNMTVSPSGKDLEHQKTILGQMSDDMFYIFMILNKLGDKNITIYDLEKNMLFDTADIDIEVLGDGYQIDAFLKDAKDIVKEHVYSYPGTTSLPYYGGGYPGYRNEKLTGAKDSCAKKRIGKRKGNNTGGSNSPASAEAQFDFYDDWTAYN